LTFRWQHWNILQICKNFIYLLALDDQPRSNRKEEFLHIGLGRQVPNPTRDPVTTLRELAPPSPDLQKKHVQTLIGVDDLDSPLL
jgi:hypothetical protein